MKFMSLVLAGLSVLCEAVVDGAASGVDAAVAFVQIEVGKLSDALQAAIRDGHIVATRGEVVITDKASPTGKGAKSFYLQMDAQDAQGMMALCNGKLGPSTAKPAEGDDTRTDEQKAPGACDYFNYGKDLDVRAKVRAQLMSSLEGPEKAIKKAVDNLVANAGMAEGEAREFVLAQRRKAGLAV
jgi:hypothetical protein